MHITMDSRNLPIWGLWFNSIGCLALGSVFFLASYSLHIVEIHDKNHDRVISNCDSRLKEVLDNMCDSVVHKKVRFAPHNDETILPTYDAEVMCRGSTNKDTNDNKVSDMNNRDI